MVEGGGVDVGRGWVRKRCGCWEGVGGEEVWMLGGSGWGRDVDVGREWVGKRCGCWEGVGWGRDVDVGREWVVTIPGIFMHELCEEESEGR